MHSGYLYSACGQVVRALHFVACRFEAQFLPLGENKPVIVVVMHPLLWINIFICCS